jgi:hypothetical protein
MEWISVNLKLPNSSSTVLITTGEYIAMADWDAEERRFRMTTREDAALIPINTITHWMPLPELPKERHNDWSRDLLLCDGVTVESRLPSVPVEYIGKVDDKQYYFRSRGMRWMMAIADSIDEAIEATWANDSLKYADFMSTGRYGVDQFDAGYMPLEQAEEIIRRCVRLWRNSRK